MAIYHLSVTHIQRSKERSATASAAYRSAEKIIDERTGEIHDYTRKKGVEHKEILTPNGEIINRDELWNLAEKAEKRKDGTPAREYNIALPAELNKEERLQLTRDFARYLINEQGCAVDFAIHAPSRSGDERNYHAHILCTTRKFLSGGELGAKCDIELSDRDRTKKGLAGRKSELDKNRQVWAELSNKALERAGKSERISHKTLEFQGIDRAPTIHLGVKATAMERRGIKTDLGEINRQILEVEQGFKQVEEKKEIIKAEPPPQPRNAFERGALERANSPKKAFVPDTRTIQEKEKDAVEAYKAWSKNQKEQEAEARAKRPPPPPKTIEEQIDAYLSIVDEHIENKTYLRVAEYEIQENAFKDATKAEIDFYKKIWRETNAEILEEKFQAYMSEVKIEADKQIIFYKEKLKSLEENKPKSLFGIGKEKIARWESDCAECEKKIKWHKKYKEPDYHQPEIKKRSFNVGDEEIEKRLDQKISTEARQKLEKGKKLEALMDRVAEKTSKVRVKILVVEQKMKSLSKGKGMGM